MDENLELEARANLAIALYADLKFGFEQKEEELKRLGAHCEGLNARLVEERTRFDRELEHHKIEKAQLEARYDRLWGSRSRLLKRGLALLFGLAGREQ